jgi:ABC-2 type transport system permease protein
VSTASALGVARTITSTSLRRLLRDRTALFFLLILPVLIIVVVGSTVQGGDRFVVGVHGGGNGSEATGIVEALEDSPSLDVRHYDDLEAMRLAVRRSELSGGVVVPAGLDDDLRAGRAVAVGFLSQPASSTGLGAEQAVRVVVADRGAVLGAAGFAADEVGATGETEVELVTAAEAAAAATPPLAVTTTVGGESRFLPMGFTYSSATMLVLFVFITAVAGGGTIIQNRRFGVYERMLAGPVSTRSVVAGEAVSFLLVSVLQSVIIVGVGAVLFEVDWGDPLAAVALVATWSAVGASAGMLAGTLLRTVEQAGAIGPMVGIAFGMLGGCMWPLEIVPPVMRAIGHAVPHGWAVDSWIELLSRGGGLGDIAGRLAVLAAFALAFGALAALRLRRQLTA